MVTELEKVNNVNQLTSYMQNLLKESGHSVDLIIKRDATFGLNIFFSHLNRVRMVHIEAQINWLDEYYIEEAFQRITRVLGGRI